MFENTIFTQFNSWNLTPELLGSFETVMSKRIPYAIYFTPRSGSSFFSDLLTKSGIAGLPGEYLNRNLLPAKLAKLRANGRSLDSIIEYMTWMLQKESTHNGVFGIKVSYFQFKPLINTGLDRLLLGKFKPFLLIRRNIIKQAISLYVFTETKLAHTNVKHPDERLEAARHLEYNQDKIRRWVKHLWIQETGWKKYFQQNAITPTEIEYEEIMNNPTAIVRRVTENLGILSSDLPDPNNSVFKIVRTSRNTELASMFLADQSNREYLLSLGISDDRFEGQ